MKKLERMRKLKEKLRDEDVENAKKEVDAAGLGFVQYEIPPDEVDEKVVRRTILQSLKSIIPYTNEWYESKAAEEEMDNLKKIRIERVKANDLYTMAKMGRHDEALDLMLSETNYDFFYFNKLKMKMEQEGKFKFEPPKSVNIFADFEKGSNRNRLKKAINQVNSFMDDKMTEELLRMANVDEQKSKKFTNDQPCVWRGRSKNGENLKCDNPRMRRPDKKKKNDGSSSSGSGGDAIAKMNQKSEAEYYQFCCYHVPFCSSGNHESSENVKIKLPNSEGFCAECYMLKMKKKPPQMSADICPGVVPFVLLGGAKSKRVKSALADIEEEEGKQNENRSKGLPTKKQRNPLQCGWTPNPSNEKLRVYECLNERAIDPFTNARLANCPWHLAKCIRIHPPGSNNIIGIPNEHGLCQMHYLADFGVHPPVLEMPFPGMKQRQLRDFWKTLDRHFAVPKSQPPPDILVHEYQPMDEDGSDFRVMFRNMAKYAAYTRRYFLFSKKAALKIQSMYRMHRAKGTHLKLKGEKMKRLRVEASIVIQSQMRRFLQTKYMKAKRKLYNDSCTQIQRIFRGWLCRRELLIDWAAKRIQRFMKLLHFFKFRDTVIMVMQMRRLFLHRNNAATFIQRIYRGYEGRMFVFRKKFYNLLRRICLKKLQRWYRYHSWRKKQPKTKMIPTEEWALQQCAKKLSRLILELYLDAKRRKELMIVMNAKAPEIQRLIRAFLAKAGTKKLRYLRKSLRSWMKPYYAVDFMKEFLRHRILDNELSPMVAVQQSPTITTHQKFFLRKFLPKDKRNALTEIDKRSFNTLLENYYHSIKLPLMQSEKDSICKRFKNTVNGTMKLQLCDEYIYHHKQPCRKHGRRICGDCYYYKNCNVQACSCNEYCKNIHHRNGICMKCNHPKNLHSIAPLQLKVAVAYTGEKKMPLLELLAFHSEADLSIPVNAKGVDLETVMIPPLQDDDVRSEAGHRIEKLKKTIKKQYDEEQATDIVKGLATCMVEGDTVYDNNKYWQQYSTSAVEPHKTYHPQAKHGAGDDVSITSITTMDLKTTVYEKVQFDTHPPNYQDIGYLDFWNIVSQNPNKKVEDYHERFQHNIPVPIISHGELVYSFDGAEIYYNLINQIITMEDIIHYDHPIFLKLVMDHIQIFERHWRKLCADIRVGKLDSRLPISKESRMIFESSNIPRPQLAEKLDNVFRQLGFHKKVLGKDIQIRAYAQKKEGMERRSPLKRKRSVPFVPTEESILSMSRLPTRQSTAQTTSLTMGTDDLLASPLQSPGKPSTAERNKRRNITTASSFPSRPSSSTKLDGSPSRRDMLKTLGETFKERKPLLQAIENQPSRPLTSLDNAIERFATSPPIRRKSQSEVQRPTTNEEVRKAGYAVTTAPREKSQYRDVMNFNDDRYVCPFPACGVTFLSKDAAIRHMITHEQKTRLSAATPHSDAHLRFYWPRDVPWLTEKKFTEKKLPPGSMRCTFPGCPEIFGTKLKLDAHLRLVHMQLHPSAVKHGYVTFDRQLKAIPPDRPMEGMNLEFCIYHAVPTGKCAVCMEIENKDGPKPPYQVYDRCAIDLKAKAEALTMTRRSETANHKIQERFDLHHLDRSYGVMLVPEKQIDHINSIKTEEIRGRPIFLLVDRNRVAWIGIERVYTMNELMANKLIPFNFHHDFSKYELFPERRIKDQLIITNNNSLESAMLQQLGEEKEEEDEQLLRLAQVQWFPMHCIQRVFPIQYLKENAVASLGSYFIR